MVKRATFLEIFLGAALLVIFLAYGFAAAREKLAFKYLPVDHDIEIVSQNYTANPKSLTETKTVYEELIRGHTNCITCRQLDVYNQTQCPDCCLDNNNATVRCRAGDPLCSEPKPKPFESECIDCSSTFKPTRPSACENRSAKSPEELIYCQRDGCPATTMPVGDNAICKQIPVSEESNNWYCDKDNLNPQAACGSKNAAVQSCNYDYATAYESTIADPAKCDAAGVPAPCFRYNVTGSFSSCVNTCTSAANAWEDDYYKYNNAILGSGICPQGECNSGYNWNCNATACDNKIKLKCNSVYTPDKCKEIETGYQKSELISGQISEFFQVIDKEFVYKFVARSGEKYWVGWQIKCDVIKPTTGENKENYNFYTMFKVLEGDIPVYQSIIHQKSLSSTFYINAQSGFAQSGASLRPGRAYTVKLYYFLPWDGNTKLQVDVSYLQMIIYRTKN